MEPGLSTATMEHREEITDHNEALKACIITGLKEMYFSEMLCDVTIQTAEECFQCHRVVLASVSLYFRVLFTCPMKEAALGEVSLSDVPSSVLKTILNYIYTGEAHLTLDNVEELFILSSRLQITPMQDLCSRYLAKRIDNENCLWIYRLAHSHNHSFLLEATLKHIGQNLSSLSKTEDFFRLEMEELVNILSSNDLMVSTELGVYNIARFWWEFRTQKDNPLPPELLKVIRLPLLNPDELGKVSWEIPIEDSPLQPSTGICLRQGMFEERLVCMDMKCDKANLEEEDYSLKTFNPTTESWERLPFCGFFEKPGIVSVGRYLYVSGGFIEKHRASNALHMYDSVLNEWKELPSMMHPRACHGFLAYRNTLYAFGGRNHSELTDSVECFDVLDNSWRNVSSIPVAMHGFASAVLKGRLFAIGGITRIWSDLVHYQGFHIYDILTDTWSKFPLPVSFSAVGAVAMDDKLYVITSSDTKHGCSVGTDPTYSDFKAYVLYTNRPSGTSNSFCMDHLGRICHCTMPPVLESVSGSTVVCWNHKIYIVGGDSFERLSFYKMFYWSPGEPRWTLLKKEVPFLFSYFGGVTLQVPLKHLLPRIPGRRSDYNFRSDDQEEDESEQ